MNDNKNALITGAGSGIGAEIAIVLAKQKYHTIITGKSLSSLKKTFAKDCGMNNSNYLCAPFRGKLFTECGARNC